MPESTPYPDDAGVEPGRGSTTGAPRWVKVFGIIALTLVVVLAILLLTGGDHGPGRHSSSGDAGGQTAPPNASESGGAGGHKPPAGGHTP